MTELPTSSPGLAAPRERDELLATKVTIPRTRPDRLARERLFQRLDEGMARELVLVCAPAGFGKSTLLADWAGSASCAVAWLSLDPDDNDPARLWRYVVAALDRVREGLREQLRPLLTAPTPLSGQGVVIALINQLEAELEKLVLVLDELNTPDQADSTIRGRSAPFRSGVRAAATSAAGQPWASARRARPRVARPRSPRGGRVLR